jgi:hypothetical protein
MNEESFLILSKNLELKKMKEFNDHKVNHFILFSGFGLKPHVLSSFPFSWALELSLPMHPTTNTIIILSGRFQFGFWSLYTRIRHSSQSANFTIVEVGFFMFKKEHNFNLQLDAEKLCRKTAQETKNEISYKVLEHWHKVSLLVTF